MAGWPHVVSIQPPFPARTSLCMAGRCALRWPETWPMIAQILPVRIHQAWLGVDARFVEEITSKQPWVEIPGARPAIPGIMPWRGKAIAVLDLGVAAGKPPRMAPD